MAEEFSKKELDMRQALKKARRRKAAKFGLQTGGAFADVRQGASIADAVAARPLYPEVKTAVQKAQEAEAVVKAMAELESGYFDTQLRSATTRYSTDLSYTGGNFRSAAATSVAASRAKAANNMAVLAALERDIARERDPNTPTAAYTAKYNKDPVGQERMAARIQAAESSPEAQYAAFADEPAETPLDAEGQPPVYDVNGAGKAGTDCREDT